MPLLLAALLASCVSLTGAAAVGAPINFLPATSPLVQWQGRTRTIDRGVAFDWESVSATFSLSGTGVRVSMLTNMTLACAGRISVWVDGFHAANMPIHAAVSSYLLAAGLKGTGSRNVTVVYTMEPVNSCAAPDGDVAVFGFESDGVFIAPPPPLSRRIDIIGDSITAGSQFDNDHPSRPVVCNDWIVTNSVWSNWHSYLCRAFGANCTVIAWSGKGLYHNNQCSAGSTMPMLYTQTEGGSPNAPPWNFARASRPDAVIVYLGTNDYSCNQTTDAGFTAAYLALLTNITTYYAGSPGVERTTFFLAVGPMEPTRPLNATLAAVAQANDAGMRAVLLDMREGALDGCLAHPGTAGHRTMALQATPQIAAAMGW